LRREGICIKSIFAAPLRSPSFDVEVQEILVRGLQDLSKFWFEGLAKKYIQLGFLF
jgi:hypothetical protein